MRKGRILPRVSDGAWPCQHLDFRLLSSRVIGAYFLLCFFFLSICSFSFLAASSLSCGTWDLHCVMWDFSLQRTESLVVGCQLGSCGLWAQLCACVILVPQAGIKPESPMLQGGFLTTGPGKS